MINEISKNDAADHMDSFWINYSLTYGVAIPNEM